MRRFLRAARVLFLAALLIIQWDITLTHKHKDQRLHLDCPICILQVSPQKKEEPKIQPKKTLLLVIFIEAPESYKKPYLTAITHKNPRAPPA